MPTVMTRSCARAINAASDIFHVRKYAARTSETRIRNQMRAVMAFWLTEAPQDAPIVEAEILFSLTLNSLASAVSTLAVRVFWNFSVWILTVSVPILVTTTSEPVASVPTAVLPRDSKLSMLVTEETRNSDPPRNSRPTLRPRPNKPMLASMSSTSDTAYQVFWRPTMSKERLPE